LHPYLTTFSQQSSTEAFIVLWVELFYPPVNISPCPALSAILSNCFHFAIFIKFVAAKILLQHWKPEMIILRRNPLI